MPNSFKDVMTNDMSSNLQLFAEQEPAQEQNMKPAGEPAQEEQPAETLESILDSVFNTETETQPAQEVQGEPPAQGTKTDSQVVTEPAQQQTTEPNQQTTELQPEQQPDSMQQILEMQRQQQYMLGMLAQAMQQNQQPDTPEPEAEPPEMFTPQIPDTLPEDLQREVDELYLEDPARALAKVSKWQQEQMIKSQQEYAIQQQKEQAQRQQETQQQFVQGFTTLIQQYGRESVDELGTRIEQIMMKEHPELLNFPQTGVQVAFQLAQAEKKQQEAQPDPATYLQKSDVRQKIKDAVRKEVIAEYLQGVQTGNQAPATIAGQPGAALAVTSPDKPQTFDEAANAMMKAFSS